MNHLVVTKSSLGYSRQHSFSFLFIPVVALEWLLSGEHGVICWERACLLLFLVNFPGAWETQPLQNLISELSFATQWQALINDFCLLSGSRENVWVMKPRNLHFNQENSEQFYANSESRNFVLTLPSSLSCCKVDCGGNIYTFDQLGSFVFYLLGCWLTSCWHLEDKSQTTHEDYE